MENDTLISLLNSISSGNLSTALKEISSDNTTLADGIDFGELLEKASDKLATQTEDDSEKTGTQELLAALDKSILGNSALGIDMSAFSEDLFSGSGREEVIEELTNGHLQSIVMTSLDDDDDDSSMGLFDTLSTGISDSTKESNTDASSESDLDELARRLSGILSQI